MSNSPDASAAEPENAESWQIQLLRPSDLLYDRGFAVVTCGNLDDENPVVSPLHSKLFPDLEDAKKYHAVNPFTEEVRGHPPKTFRYPNAVVSFQFQHCWIYDTDFVGMWYVLKEARAVRVVSVLARTPSSQICP